MFLLNITWTTGTKKFFIHFLKDISRYKILYKTTKLKNIKVDLFCDRANFIENTCKIKKKLTADLKKTHLVKTRLIIVYCH